MLEPKYKKENKSITIIDLSVPPCRLQIMNMF